jgi:hypothetical protein
MAAAKQQDRLYDTIYTFSDIHGDINNLIINLRDNAKVIMKKTKFKFKQDTYDEDLKKLMEISVDSKKYIDDLNYEWIGPEKTLIVIIGDTLDNHRDNSYMDMDTNGKVYGKVYGEYTHEEYKIFKFLLEMKKQAQQKESNIEVLYGNHELMNLLGDNSYVSEYAMKTSFQYIHKVITRSNLFKLNEVKGLENNIGVRLFLELDMKIVFVYKQYIFVHGGILGKIDTHDFSNYQQINDIFNNILITQNIKKLKSVETSGIYSVLWERKYSEYSELSKETSLVDFYNATRLCSELNTALTNFCNNHDSCPTTLVVGHCTNYSYYITNNYPTCTFNKLINGDNVSETYGYTDETPKDCKKFDLEMKETKYDAFRSTFEKCSLDASTDPASQQVRLLRVDNASSRAFYMNYMHELIIKHDSDLAKHLKTYLIPRLPQLVKIEINDVSYIITNISSSLQNKLIHSPINYQPDLIIKINALYPPNTLDQSSV